MRFYTKYDRSPRVHSRIGDHFLNTYRLEFSSDGAEVLIPNGCIDVYARIQAAAPAQEISNIYAKFCSGDAEAFNVKNGVYVDARNIPDNIIELNNMIRKAEDDFYNLPADLREKFANNPSEFFKDFGNANWIKIMEDFYSDSSDIPDGLSVKDGDILE